MSGEAIDPLEALERLVQAWSHDAKNEAINRDVRITLNICAESLRTALASRANVSAEYVQSRIAEADLWRDRYAQMAMRADRAEKTLGSREEPVIEVFKEKRSVDGFRVKLYLLGLHPDLTLYSLVLKQESADKLAAALRGFGAEPAQP